MLIDQTMTRDKVISFSSSDALNDWLDKNPVSKFRRDKIYCNVNPTTGKYLWWVHYSWEEKPIPKGESEDLDP